MTIYTLATTIVEECNKAETGVGPSIAKGSQLLANNKEDLVQIAITIKKNDLITMEENKQRSPTQL